MKWIVSLNRGQASNVNVGCIHVNPGIVCYYTRPALQCTSLLYKFWYSVVRNIDPKFSWAFENDLVVTQISDMPVIGDSQYLFLLSLLWPSPLVMQCSWISWCAALNFRVVLEKFGVYDYDFMITCMYVYMSLDTCYI